MTRKKILQKKKNRSRKLRKLRNMNVKLNFNGGSSTDDYVDSCIEFYEKMLENIKNVTSEISTYEKINIKKNQEETDDDRLDKEEEEKIKKEKEEELKKEEQELDRAKEQEEKNKQHKDNLITEKIKIGDPGALRARYMQRQEEKIKKKREEDEEEEKSARRKEEDYEFSQITTNKKDIELTRLFDKIYLAYENINNNFKEFDITDEQRDRLLTNKTIEERIMTSLGKKTFGIFFNQCLTGKSTNFFKIAVLCRVAFIGKLYVFENIDFKRHLSKEQNIKHQYQDIAKKLENIPTNLYSNKVVAPELRLNTQMCIKLGANITNIINKNQDVNPFYSFMRQAQQYQ